jgi:hypothetical protein
MIAPGSRQAAAQDPERSIRTVDVCFRQIAGLAVSLSLK